MKKIFLIAATALILAACDKNDDNPAPSTVAAQISATIGGSAVSRAGDNKWAPGDRIGITNTFRSQKGPFINMDYSTAAGNGDFRGNPIYIYNPMSVTAYYPFAGEEGKEAGSITASTTAAYQDAENQPKIDFLFAAKEGITTDSPIISLNFTHCMSKLTLIFVSGDGADVSKISSYKIDGLILDGTFNTATGICAVKSDATATPLEINFPDVEDGDGVEDGKELAPLILFPQSTLNKEVKLTITDNENQVYACALNFTDNTIAAGNNYVYTITVKKTGLSVDKSTITDWNKKDLSTDAESVL